MPWPDAIQTAGSFLEGLVSLGVLVAFFAGVWKKFFDSAPRRAVLAAEPDFSGICLESEEQTLADRILDGVRYELASVKKKIQRPQSIVSQVTSKPTIAQNRDCV